MTGAPEPLEVVSDGSAASALFHPTRLRILQALGSPGTAAGVARQLGEPRQRLGHHLRQLEGAGLVELVEERRKGNVTERVVRASAHSYVVDPGLLGPVSADPATVRNELSVSYLVAVLTRGVRELARLRRLAQRSRTRLPALTVDTQVRLATPDDQARFARELAGAVGEVVARYHDDDAPRGRSFRVLAGAYPVPPESPDSPDSPGQEDQEDQEDRG